jgi:heme-degrading monooxygenase HmoA
MTASKSTDSLTIIESAFKIIPGRETDFLAFQASVIPLATAQDGFRSVYSGPIMDSSWVYFGARFENEELMNTWHEHPQHRVIQRSAPRWWTSLYLRKWRALSPGELPGARLMVETNLRVDTEFDDARWKVVRQALATLGPSGALPFETLTGEFEAHPFQFVGPFGIVPATDKLPYLLVTHWTSADRFEAWKSSDSYRALEGLGDVTSELFVAVEEKRQRENLREDRLQRDWDWAKEGSHWRARSRPRALPTRR